MVEHLLAIDDVADDFEKIIRWAIEFKRAWKSGDDALVSGRIRVAMLLGLIGFLLPMLM